MTYCVGLDLTGGLVMLADTRTNAGVDNISTFSKMHVIEQPGERVILLMSAGNLAVTQAILNVLEEGEEDEATGEVTTLNNVPRMFKAAQLVGRAVRAVYSEDGEAMQAQNISFDVSILMGGQIKGGKMRLYQIYSTGNFIEATADTPFLQIGEHKYGKPILDRAASPGMPLIDGVKLALISMDSTLRSNLTVGLPVDLLVVRRDSLEIALRKRIDEEDDYFTLIRQSWSEALKNAYRAIPRPGWLEDPE